MYFQIKNAEDHDRRSYKLGFVEVYEIRSIPLGFLGEGAVSKAD